MDLRYYALIALAACAAPTGEDSATTAPSNFSAIRDNVLLPTCGFSTCHGSGSGGMTLTESGAYGALVGVPSVGAPGETRVIPGDPDGSYLVHKLEGAAGIVGTEMPPGSTLEDAQIEGIRSWIADGAQDD